MDCNRLHEALQKGESGPCTFGQRQGYIDIDLRNGDTVSLSPTNQANHFKDQKGNKVVRTGAGSDRQEYKWEGGRRVIVTFASSPSYGGSSAARRVVPARSTSAATTTV